STNYMVVLFLVDLALSQAALALGMSLRYLLPWGQTVLPVWGPEFVYTPTAALHATVALVWATSFVLGSVYTPRRVIFWFDELQRVLFCHTAAALSFAG